MSAVDFHLRYHEGRARLGLREPSRLGMVVVPRLDLDVPRLRFPFEMSADPRQFQSRYCDLAGLDVELDPAALAAWLERRPKMARFGLHAPTVRFGRSAIQLGLRLDVGEISIYAALRLLVGPGERSPRHIVVHADSVCLFGPSALPATLLPATLVSACSGPESLLLQESGRPGSSERIIDLAEIEVDVVEALLWEILPPSGFRLPRYRKVALDRVDVSPRALSLSFIEPTVVVPATAAPWASASTSPS